jgi:hypothetical protein
MDLISVTWTDSGIHTDHGWASKEKYLEGINPPESNLVQTAGIKMHEDDDCIVVALSYDPVRNTWYGAEMILKSNVLSIDTLTMHTT